MIDPLRAYRNRILYPHVRVGAKPSKSSAIHEDPWIALKKALSGVLEGDSFEDLMKGRTLTLRRRPLDGYQTPSGRIEFYSTKAKKLGLSPLPKQLPLRKRKNEFILLNTAMLLYTYAIPGNIWFHTRYSCDK